MIQHVDAFLLGLGDVVEAPLPPRFSRNIPDETVKALAFCLVITTFLAVTTGVRATKRCVGVFCSGVLLIHCSPTIWKVRHVVSCRGTRLLRPV